MTSGLEAITKADFNPSGLSNAELISHHDTMHGMHRAVRFGVDLAFSTQQVVGWHAMVVAELVSRGLRHPPEPEDGLDESLEEVERAVEGPADYGSTPVEKFELSIDIPISKRDDEKRLVTGVVLEPDTIDAHKDFEKADTIEEAAHDFLAKYQRESRLGLMHKIFGEIGVELVESWITKEDTEIGGQAVKKGSWIITVKVLDNEVWKKIKTGEITGFSIGAVATVAA